ncbi:MAG: GIY-YIG nuclease family protein [Proteobacteria bacterium]|nr:GIY-YIG nuclease family protein [Pseudomonadota bacterium]
MQDSPRTYQLFIYIKTSIVLLVGSMGELKLKQGRYVYTGSARKNIISRVARHLSDEKKLHWHIDYLLTHPAVKITDVRFYRLPECELNQMTAGSFPLSGFGASDCVAGCVSHLCFQGNALHYPEVC